MTGREGEVMNAGRMGGLVSWFIPLIVFLLLLCLGVVRLKSQAAA